MAKKTMKETVNAGTSVFDQIASGNVQHAKDVQGVQSVPRAKDVKRAQKEEQSAADKVEFERLNLKIPADIKAYLQAAAYRESSPTKTVSLTEYLCQLVRADMKKHKDK